MKTGQATRRAVVVYESMFGNTAAVAAAIADGLTESGMSVELAEVSTAPPAGRIDAELLVLGAPTHAFSLSRPGTREDAVRQGAAAAHTEIGLREWLAQARRHPRAAAVPVAAFDTKVTRVRRLPGSAARKMASLARAARLDPPLGVESFYVTDVAGPLDEGELDRAKDWARSLATRVPA